MVVVVVVQRMVMMAMVVMLLIVISKFMVTMSISVAIWTVRNMSMVTTIEIPHVVLLATRIAVLFMVVTVVVMVFLMIVVAAGVTTRASLSICGAVAMSVVAEQRVG